MWRTVCSVANGCVCNSADGGDPKMHKNAMVHQIVDHLLLVLQACLYQCKLTSKRFCHFFNLNDSTLNSTNYSIKLNSSCSTSSSSSSRDVAG